MDVPFQNPDVLRLAELQVNPILDALNNAFDEFSRVVVSNCNVVVSK